MLGCEFEMLARQKRNKFSVILDVGRERGETRGLID